MFFLPPSHPAYRSNRIADTGYRSPLNFLGKNSNEIPPTIRKPVMMFAIYFFKTAPPQMLIVQPHTQSANSISKSRSVRSVPVSHRETTGHKASKCPVFPFGTSHVPLQNPLYHTFSPKNKSHPTPCRMAHMFFHPIPQKLVLGGGFGGGTFDAKVPPPIYLSRFLTAARGRKRCRQPG